MRKESDIVLTALSDATNEFQFSLAKTQLNNWLTRRFFFFSSSEKREFDLIPDQAQRLSQIATHPLLQTWASTRNIPLPELNNSSAGAFSNALDSVMGNETNFPTLAARLRDKTAIKGGILLENLPGTGFVGFWWDPLTHFCYLGWQEDAAQGLYASVGDDRQIFYKIEDIEHHENVWRSLDRFNRLDKGLAALRRDEITAVEFFELSIPFAWQLHCTKVDVISLPSGVVKHPILPEVVSINGASPVQFYYAPENDQSGLPISITQLSTFGYQLDFHPLYGNASPDQDFSSTDNKQTCSGEFVS
ncbi:hypothetical protein [Rouxiella sp. WC2420]|uniref:Uncharacterized protein n=1 Tax=Rouxiella sp. WC2420 TaxID=3234145 RepID=A0AB39VMG7_9GAMM